MSFPTVKSDPWKKARRRVRSALWSTAFWNELVKRAGADYAITNNPKLSDGCFAMICDMNEWLYGKTTEVCK